MNALKKQTLLSAILLGLLLGAYPAITTPLIGQEDEDEIYELGEFTVRPIEEGAASALADQKASSLLTTIVSEETLESLPDQSVGEALSRLPGIAISKDRGEADRIFIRGVDSRLNAVTINGDRLPSPESTVANVAQRGNRSVRLNTIPASIVNEIEVFKSVPPNRDADSIGGAVEIRTKSATQLDGPIMDSTIRYGYNDLPEKDVWSVEFTYGDRISEDGKWGMMATASWEENNRAVEGLTASWDVIDEVLDLATDEDVDLGGDRYVMEDYDIIWRDLRRIRKGANIVFDHAISNDSILKFGGFWSEFDDRELRRRLQLRPGAGADYTTETVFNSDGIAVSGSTDGGRVRRRVRPGVKLQETYNYFLEGSHTFGEGDWILDWRISNSFASRSLSRTRTRWEVRGSDIDQRGDGIADWTFTNGDQDIVHWTQPDWGNDPDLLHVGDRGDYRQRRNDNSEDEVAAFRFDIEKNFQLSDGTFDLEFGYKGRFDDRIQLNKNFDYDGVEDETIYMAETLGERRITPKKPYGLENGQWGDQTKMDAIFASSPERFDFDGENSEEDYFLDEEIHAGYLMGTWTSGDWTTIAGVRYESTDLTIEARDGIGRHDYDNFFPALITRYQASENIVIRGAWTNSIGRPDFYDLRPFFSDEFDYDLNDDTGQYEGELFLDGGNPQLDPFEAENFDLSFEYYTDNGGIFSAGIFNKDITNFEYVEQLNQTNVSVSSLPDFLQGIANEAIDDARQDNPDIPANFDNLARFFYQRPVNGDRSTIDGLEFTWQQQFQALPDPFNNFGILANYTTIDGNSDITADISRDFIIGQFDNVMNLQLYYETDKLSARIAHNRNGITYETLGLEVDGPEVVSSPVEDRARDSEYSTDVSIQYRINREDSQVTIYFDIRNITDEVSVRRFLGSGDTIRRFSELEAGGRRFIVGLKWQM